MALSTQRLSQIAQQFAPIVVLHPDDPWMPIDPIEFIAAASLRVAGTDRKAPLADTGQVDASKLGGSSGLNGYRAHFADIGRDLYAWQMTRPFDKQPARVEIDESAGFYLSLERPPVVRELSNTPMLYEWRDDQTLCYWFCMGGSSLPQNVRAALIDAVGRGGSVQDRGTPARPTATSASGREALQALAMSGANIEAFPGLDAGRDVVAGLERLEEVHEGDWEGMTVRFDGETPTVVELHEHGRATLVDFGELATEDGRPTVYSGLGSHATVASSAAAGAETVDVEGPRWKPPVELVIDAEQQPWYGFGGAWGRRRRPPLGGVDSLIRWLIRQSTSFDVWEESTGPTGPSTYKLR